MTSPHLRAAVLTDHMIDQLHGYIEWSDGTVIFWSSGFGEGQPPCYDDCSVVERQTIELPNGEWTIGRLVEPTSSASFIYRSFVGFRIDDDSKVARRVLQELAGSYTMPPDTDMCTPPSDNRELETVYRRRRPPN